MLCMLNFVFIFIIANITGILYTLVYFVSDNRKFQGWNIICSSLSITISRYLQIQRAEISLIQTIRNFIKSIKNRDLDLHMYAPEKMLYWFHAYENYNYARLFILLGFTTSVT